MNEDLHEKFRSTGIDANTSSAGEVYDSVYYMNRLEAYSREENQVHDDKSWLSRPELPTAEELFSPGPEIDPSYWDDSSTPSLQPNVIDGPWQDKEEYLSTHYELLRENTLRPLREAIHQVQQMPFANESDFPGKSIGLYQNVR